MLETKGIQEESANIKPNNFMFLLCWCVLELNVEGKIYDKEQNWTKPEHKNGWA